MILLLTFGTRGGDGDADHHRDRSGSVIGLSVVALLGQAVEVPTTAPALATMIGLGRRHRLRPLHRHPAPRAAARRDGPAGVGGARDRDLRRRRRLRRQHGDHRAALAAASPASRSSPRSATRRRSSSRSRCSPRSRCCRPCSACSARGSTRCSCPALKHAPRDTPARLASLGRLVADHPWPRIVRGVILLVLAIPCSRWSSARPTTARRPPTPRRAVLRPHHRRLRRRANGPLLVAVDLTKPAPNDQRQLDDFKQQQKDAEKKQQDESSRRHSSSSAGRAARSGPAAGPPADAAEEAAATRPAGRRPSSRRSSSSRRPPTRACRTLRDATRRRRGRQVGHRSRSSTTPAPPRSTRSSRRARRPRDTTENLVNTCATT